MKEISVIFLLICSMSVFFAVADGPGGNASPSSTTDEYIQFFNEILAAYTVPGMDDELLVAACRAFETDQKDAGTRFAKLLGEKKVEFEEIYFDIHCGSSTDARGLQFHFTNCPLTAERFLSKLLEPTEVWIQQKLAGTDEAVKKIFEEIYLY